MASLRVADHIGRVLGGRYRLSAVIGTGASAHVFLADDARLARRVAVKILHPALADDAAFLRRFRAEAHAAAALSHPNVLAVYDWGEEEDGPYIVTEFLGGGSLRAMLDRGHRLSPSQGLMVGLDAARGLDYAHRRGLVHRDIKPANLLFDEEGRLRIADFGLARALAEAAWTEPTGAVLGTARYAAPEQIRGTPLDGKADVYALAVVLVEAVSGRVPFAADTTVGTILGRLERPLEVPDELGPMAPILRRAGLPDPAERPDAMALFAAFQVLASKLPAPEPLPLAGPAIFDQVGGVADSDPTEMGVATPAAAAAPSPPSTEDAADGRKASKGLKGSRATKRSKAATAADPTVADLPRPEVQVADSPTSVVPEPVPLEPSKAGRPRRRWKRVVLAVVLAFICSAVGTVAFVRAQVPTHPVPLVVGQEAPAAQGELERLGFDVAQRAEFNDVEPKGKVLSQTPATGKLKEGKVVTLVVSNGPTPVNIPELANLSQEEATAALEKAVLKLGDVTSEYSETVDAGVVLDWSPKGPAHHGDTVALVVSRGPQPRTLPDLTAMTYDQAARELQNLGLVAERDERYDNLVAAGKIIGTRPPVGNKVERGSRVTIVLSKGRPVVPNLNGMNQAQAKAALEAVSLKLGNVFGIGGTVFRSSPDTGSTVDVGTPVSVFIL